MGSCSCHMDYPRIQIILNNELNLLGKWFQIQLDNGFYFLIELKAAARLKLSDLHSTNTGGLALGGP